MFGEEMRESTNELLQLVITKPLTGEVKTLVKTVSKVLGLKDTALENDFFIAGGAIKDTLYPETEINDVDVFFRTTGAYKVAVANLVRNGWVQHHATDKAECYVDENSADGGSQLKLDLIKAPEAGPKEAILTFDFTVCQFAADNYNLYTTVEAERDQAVKNLVVANFRTPTASLLRISKYVERGYKIPREELRKFAARVAESGIEEVNRVISMDQDKTSL